MEGHILVECMFLGWHILQCAVFGWKTCFTGGHLFLEDMYSRSTCFAVYDVVHFIGGISYRKLCTFMKACPKGRHVL